MGGGVFDEQSRLPVAQGGGSIVIGDLDGDQDLDLVTSHFINGLSILLNNGDGTFANAVGLDSGMFTLTVEVGDIDGDLDLDLIVIEFFFEDAIRTFLNNGDGTFGPGSNVFDDFANDLDLFDVDGDGDLDMVVSTSASVITFLNDGNGSYAMDAELMIENSRIVSGDLDGDADIDIVLDSSNELSILLNDGAGGFVFDQQLDVPMENFDAFGLADFDLDADLDIIVSGTTIFLNNNDGSYAEPIELVASPGDSFALFDIDQDTDVDLVTINESLSTVSFLFNDCEPDFLLGDVNLDGQVDLLDVVPFIDLIANSRFQLEADINQDGVVNLIDVAPFVELLTGT